jgi:hypothetical protein
MLLWYKCYGNINIKYIPKKTTSKLSIGCVYTAYVKIIYNS